MPEFINPSFFEEQRRQIMEQYQVVADRLDRIRPIFEICETVPEHDLPGVAVKLGVYAIVVALKNEMVELMKKLVMLEEREIVYKVFVQKSVQEIEHFQIIRFHI
uniref:Uncharacterized protein n=1 Tax=Caenorhabditis japonica TaxID=281687 RepID=A0A8R1E3X3_CAEJA